MLLTGGGALQAPAEARGFHRGGGGHVDARAHVNRNIKRNVNVNGNINRNVSRTVNRRYVYRNGRWRYWRNGALVAAPAVAGAVYVASCAYEYNRWQSTGSTYWRDRHYQCAN
jgi:hypothetical protein